MTELAVREAGQLQRYDPNKGLKSIAVAEAGETHFARAKDATGLCAAIEAKLCPGRIRGLARRGGCAWQWAGARQKRNCSSAISFTSRRGW